MNSLLGYGNGSDDDLDESPDNRQMDLQMSSRPYKKLVRPQDDTNYDEVQMSLSEDSDSESKSQQKHGRDRLESYRNAPKGRREDPPKDRRDDRRDDKERSNGPAERTEDRSRYRDKDEPRIDRPRTREEEKPRFRDGKDDERERAKREEDRTRERGDRFREEDRVRDRRDDRREGSREKYGGRDDRYRKERDRRRSRSPRDRKRSRSPRRGSRSPRRGERSRSRSRERGVGRGGRGGGFQRRFDRVGPNRTERTDKTGAESKGEEPSPATPSASADPNQARFFVPGLTGRFRDQIEKRKLLWQKKEPEKPQAVSRPMAAAGSRTTKVWEATTFAQDTDGKVANKFKRLMGIRGAGDNAAAPAVEVLKKQEEMFSSMEQQYEVARTATHTMRGVGLGFGSYPR
ncbi:unnamed protein product [Phaedon cochleariae]|uniref:Small acidic protein-like domain-containing protein n=1 Tax=Phaedon cochleariae TaxID=80249 RepID=A0A9N9SD65_PHACE|nr:unnamed protein product [Phaedon cochleariae]